MEISVLGYLELGGSSVWIQMAIATLVSVPLILRQQISRGLEKLRRRNRK
jgi:hypothetical protein